MYQYQNKKDEEKHENYMDYVLDITIAYPDGKPLDLPNIVTGMRPPCQTFLLYRLYHTSEVSEATSCYQQKKKRIKILIVLLYPANRYQKTKMV